MKAALAVFQYKLKKDSKFQSQQYSGLHNSIFECRDWNGTGLHVGLIQQARAGSQDCVDLVTKLADVCEAGMIVMIGVCAGVAGKVDLGSVIAVEKTVVVTGKVQEAGTVDVDPNHQLASTEVVAAVRDMNVSEEGSVWLSYNPEGEYCPTPRYVRDIVLFSLRPLECEQTMTKKDIKTRYREYLDYLQLEQKKADKMLDGILDNMVESSAVRKEGGRYKLAESGQEEVESRDDDDCLLNERGNPPEVRLLVNTMATSKDLVREDFRTVLEGLQKGSAELNIVSLDIEGYDFLYHANRLDCFRRAAIFEAHSDYGTPSSKVDYYQRYAACNAAAVLRHLVTMRPDLTFL